jgi:hypothetical protein
MFLRRHILPDERQRQATEEISMLKMQVQNIANRWYSISQIEDATHSLVPCRSHIFKR